jgi:hypothetical protein
VQRACTDRSLQIGYLLECGTSQLVYLLQQLDLLALLLLRYPLYRAVDLAVLLVASSERYGLQHLLDFEQYCSNDMRRPLVVVSAAVQEHLLWSSVLLVKTF